MLADAQRGRVLLEESREAVVILDDEDRVVGASRRARQSIEGLREGVGVPEAELPRLFERFFRSDRSRASRGTGLGLAIVKHIVTQAGGTVDARGGLGAGLEVRCTFPPR